MDENIRDIKLLRRIEDIGLPENIASDLRWYGNIKTLKRLIETDVVDLLKIYGIGEKKVSIIIDTLGAMGLSIVDSRKPKSPPKTSVRTVEFPHNLLAYIFEHKSSFRIPEVVTRDIIDGIHFACLSLNDKQQAALYLRFECHQTLDKIGQRFSLSGTQIENIISKSIHTWFKTDDIKYIEYGMKGYVNHLVITKAKALAGNSILEEYQRGYEDGYEDGCNNSKGASIQQNNSHLIYMPVEELDLSVRSYNCIKRAGIDTVQDLISRTEEDMLRVRNLGKKGIDEIRDKLSTLGLSYLDEKAVKDTCCVKKIVFEENDGEIYDKTKIIEHKDGEVVVENIIAEELDKKLCKINVPLHIWDMFINEFIIENDFLNWSEERFSAYNIDNFVLDDLTCNLEIVTDEKTLKYSGSTSSNGVKLIRYLLDKYFTIPDDASYTVETESFEDIDIF